MPAPAQLASRPGSPRSITCTEWPWRARSQASDRPMTPPPMIKTSCMGSFWLGGEQAAEKHFVHAAAKPHVPVDLDDRDTSVESLAECRVGIDIDQHGRETVAGEQRERIIAKVAALAGIEDDLWHR